MNLRRAAVRFTTDKDLARATFLNILANVTPVVLGLAFLPLLVVRYGHDRFGLLSLLWTSLAYFMLLDLGLGRALTQLVARRSLEDRPGEMRSLLVTSLAFVLLCGGVLALALVLSAGLVAQMLLRVPPGLTAEATRAVRLLAALVPVTVSLSVVRGYLEGRRHFGRSALIRASVSSLGYLVPVGACLITQDLSVAVAGILVTRVAVLLLGLALCRSDIGAGSGWAANLSVLKELVRTGGWVTVSNVVSPVMATLDRFLVAHLVSLAAAGYYATAQQVGNQLVMLPASLAAVLFPLFASGSPVGGRESGRLYGTAMKWVAVSLAPVIVIVLLVAEPILKLWIGSAFAENILLPLKILAVGALVNGLAQIPFSALQGSGRAKLTALSHVLELPLYLGFVIFLTREYGIVGTAIAWTGRVLLDFALLAAAARWSLGRTWSVPAGSIAVGAIVVTCGFLGSAPGPWPVRVSLMAVATAGIAWQLIGALVERRSAPARLGVVHAHERAS
jgi:O-antigen/teichoic acid export membrane protein